MLTTFLMISSLSLAAPAEELEARSPSFNVENPPQKPTDCVELELQIWGLVGQSTMYNAGGDCLTDFPEKQWSELDAMLNYSYKGWTKHTSGHWYFIDQIGYRHTEVEVKNVVNNIPSFAQDSLEQEKYTGENVPAQLRPYIVYLHPYSVEEAHLIFGYATAVEQLEAISGADCFADVVEGIALWTRAGQAYVATRHGIPEPQFSQAAGQLTGYVGCSTIVVHDQSSLVGHLKPITTSSQRHGEYRLLMLTRP